MIRARMFFVFKGQPDFFRMRDKLAISTDEEISGSASRKLPAPHIGVSCIFKQKTLTLLARCHLRAQFLRWILNPTPRGKGHAPSEAREDTHPEQRRDAVVKGSVP